MMVFPPLTETFVRLYGWRATFMLLAALNAHCILSGAIVKQLRHIKYTPVRDTDEDTRKPNGNSSAKRSMKDMLTYMAHSVDAHVFNLYPVFIDFQLIFLILGTTLAAWVLFLVPDSMDKGIPSNTAAFLSTIGGVGHVFGRLVQGPLINWGIITDLQLFGILSILCTLCFIADPWMSMFLTLAISAFVVGFVTGAQYTLCLTMTKRLVTESDLLLSAMGYTHLFIGIGKMIGGTLVGTYSYIVTLAYQKLYFGSECPWSKMARVPLVGHFRHKTSYIA